MGVSRDSSRFEKNLMRGWVWVGVGRTTPYLVRMTFLVYFSPSWKVFLASGGRGPYLSLCIRMLGNAIGGGW